MRKDCADCHREESPQASTMPHPTRFEHYVERVDVDEKTGTARVAVRTTSGNLVHYIVATEKKVNAVISRHATVSG